MTFAAEAFVAQGAADHPIDLEDFGLTLQLAAKQTKTAIVFALRGDGGRASEVTLALPDTISIFEVDPRGSEADSGLGPVFYKEWQLTGTAKATGVLQPLVESGDRKVTLTCTAAAAAAPRPRSSPTGRSRSTERPASSLSMAR